jgi:hypothetical protein
MPQDLVTWLPPVETGANGSASAPSVCAERTLDDALCRAVWVHRRLDENHNAAFPKGAFHQY